MMQPSITRIVKINQPVSGTEIKEALRKVSSETGGRYVEHLISDHDGVQTWTIGILGKDPHEDIDIRTGYRGYTGLGCLAVQFDKQYEVVGVGSTHWYGYHDVPLSYDPHKMIEAVVRVQEGLEKLLSGESKKQESKLK